MCLVTIPLQVNQRQRLIVQHYVANGGNASAAAREAGYRGTDGAIRVQAHRMLTSVNVQNAIAEHQQQIAKSAEGLKLSPDWVLGELRANYRAAKQDKQYAAANRSLELLGRHLGLFEEQPPRDDFVVKWLAWRGGKPQPVIVEGGKHALNTGE